MRSTRCCPPTGSSGCRASFARAAGRSRPRLLRRSDGLRRRLHPLPGDAAARRFDERGEVEAEAGDLALGLDPAKAAALEHLGVEQVELADVAAERVSGARAAQAKGFERRDAAVLERRLDLLEEELEAAQVLLVVEVRTGDDVGREAGPGSFAHAAPSVAGSASIPPSRHARGARAPPLFATVRGAPLYSLRTNGA